MKRNASSRLEKQLNILEFPMPPSDDGQTLEKSNHIDCPLDIELSKSKKKKIIVYKKKELQSCIQESLVINNQTICKDRDNISKSDAIQTTTSTFKILHPDSISEEEALSEFWTPSKKAKYEALSWLPKIDWLDSGSISSNGYVKNTEQKSWFSITTIKHQQKNLEKTSCQLFKFIVANGMDKEDTKKIMKTWKLKLFPTKEQKQILNKWAGCSRFTYNKTIACLNNPRNNCKSWMNLRNRFVTAKSTKGINNFFNNKKWLIDTPKHIRLSAVKEACKNLKSCFTNKRNGNIKSFNLQYKTKKKEQQYGWSLGLEKNNVSKEDDKLIIFKTILGNIKYGGRKQLHKLIPGNKPIFDPRIQKDRFGDYYLLVTIEQKIKNIPKVHTSIQSYDPGVNVYLTGYDPSGEAIMIGKGCNDRLLTLLEKLDDLISQRTRTRGKESLKMNRRIIVLRKKIFNLKNELHNQVNNIVAKSSTLVLYPRLASKDLSLKERRQLTTKTVRQMLNLGHCKAYDKLLIKCKEHGTELLTVSEAYTTKTCPCCGKLNHCSNDRIYKCSCNYIAERDLNGAQNILLRNIGS